LEEILGLKDFPECFQERRKMMWQATFGPRVANCLPVL